MNEIIGCGKFLGPLERKNWKKASLGETEASWEGRPPSCPAGPAVVTLEAAGELGRLFLMSCPRASVTSPFVRVNFELSTGTNPGASPLSLFQTKGKSGKLPSGRGPH